MLSIIKKLVVNGVLEKIEKGKYFLKGSKINDFVLANFVYSSFYISFESALNFYGILSQFPYEITSATTKKTTEKIRAILTRKKGRDLYDLWHLFNQGVNIDDKLVKEKLKYYGLENIKNEEILKRLKKFSEKDFVLDMRPFVPTNEREKLASLFIYVKDCLKRKLS